ncbi:LuxR C-terminal-related transcriptional regulator [Agrobacterium tumefaciens]|nr:LuxR C-terminal-related transcriptional regulator [Agrobacterium tumefaciens]
MSSQVQHGCNHPYERTLSDIERQYLGLIARGQHPSRIAAATETDEKDVRDILESARTKLGATNLLNAVSTALLRGLIDRNI